MKRVRWDWIAGFATMASYYLLGRGEAWQLIGWSVSLVGTIPWWLLILNTRQWGLVPMQIMLTAMCAYNLYQWIPK